MSFNCQYIIFSHSLCHVALRHIFSLFSLLMFLEGTAIILAYCLVEKNVCVNVDVVKIS